MNELQLALAKDFAAGRQGVIASKAYTRDEKDVALRAIDDLLTRVGNTLAAEDDQFDFTAFETRALELWSVR